MPRRTILVPPRMQPESQALKTLVDSDPPEQKEESALTEFDHEIECPRCNDVMELGFSFNALAYSCENCCFILKCV